MLEDIHTCWLSPTLYACWRCRLVCTKEKTLQSTAQLGTARHRTQGTTPARQRTALRRAVELAKLNQAGGVFFRAFRYTQLGVTRKKT